MISLYIPIYILFIYLAITVDSSVRRQILSLKNMTFNGEKWREEILNGVTQIEVYNNMNSLIVYGDHADAIVTGITEADCFIACAEIERGRIAIFGHHSFGYFIGGQRPETINIQFNSNIRKWLTRGQFNNNNEVLYIKDIVQQKIKTLADLKKYKMLVALIENNHEPILSSMVLDYLKQGGSLVYSATPWTYVQGNPIIGVNGLPYYSILKEVGIAYTLTIVNLPIINTIKVPISRNKAATAHFTRFITDSNMNLEKICNHENWLQNMNSLPEKYFKNTKPTIYKYWKESFEKLNSLYSNGKLYVSNEQQRKMVNFWMLGYNLFPEPNLKAPAISEYPGDFTAQPIFLPLQTINIDQDLAQMFPTGFYVAAGQTIKADVMKITGKWTLWINSQTSHLNSVTIRRWPYLVVKKGLSSGDKINISSPFGGLLYFRLEENIVKGNLQIKVSSLVESPFYDLSNLHTRGKDYWLRKREAPGLWTDLCGKHIMISVPSYTIRNMEDPADVLTLYDKLLEAYHDLRGTDINKTRREWIVVDNRRDLLLSGYPIMANMGLIEKEAVLLNASWIKTKGSFGVFHELGHNMQEGTWTFSGTLEVTVNIFTHYGMLTICGKDTWNDQSIKRLIPSATRHLSTGASFDKWMNDPATAFVVYAQLFHHLGWDAYKRVFRRYRNLKPIESVKTNQDKIDLWYSIFSQETGLNLMPLAYFWNIPISAKALDEVNKLKFADYLPDDEVTKSVPLRVEEVIKLFPNLARETCKK